MPSAHDVICVSAVGGLQCLEGISLSSQAVANAALMHCLWWGVVQCGLWSHDDVGCSLETPI